MRSRPTIERSSARLRAFAPRPQAAIGAVGFTVMAGVCSWLVPRAAPSSWVLACIVCAFAVAMGVGAVVFVRLFVRPPVMLEATSAGLISYVNAETGSYAANGVLIPWRQIREIAFFSGSVSSGGSRVRIKAARLSLVPGHGLPIGALSVVKRLTLPFGIDGSRNTGIDWNNTIFLNAATSWGKPEALVQTLEDLRRAG
jgi:hypothetical protein